MGCLASLAVAVPLLAAAPSTSAETAGSSSVTQLLLLIGIFGVAGTLFYLVQSASSARGRLNGVNSNGRADFTELVDVSLQEGAHFFERLCWASALLCNIATAVLAIHLGTRLIPNHVLVATLVPAFVVVTAQFLLLDIMARHIGLVRSDWVLRWLAPPVTVLSYPIRPFLALLFKIADAARPSDMALFRVVQNPELRMLPHVRGVDRVVEEEAVEMIDSVREFTESIARDIMTPRTEIDGVALDTPRDALMNKLHDTHNSRLIVYESNLDHIVGFLLAKEVLLNDPRNPFDLIRKPLEISVTTRLPDVLVQMRQKRSYLAVVLDEYGGTAGILTLHDLFEAIIGEHLSDEEEEDELWIETDGPDRARLSGRVELWEINQELDLALDEAVARTIGGYLMYRFGRLPQVGDQWAVDGGNFTVGEIVNNRIETLTFDRDPNARELRSKMGEETS